MTLPARNERTGTHGWVNSSLSDSNEQKTPRDDHGKRILICAVVAIVIFLLGLVPMTFVAHSRAVPRDNRALNYALAAWKDIWLPRR
ncbi:MAG TPA: hypothetical protein VLE19_04715 [Pyrinomonadaceae bacterium]|nr:hypothetical protein [Pyrinomonadaceae bacterium]